MSNERLSLGRLSIRGTDSSSLLRMYDLARQISATSPSQQERAKADKASRRLAKELQKRKVPL